MKKSSLILLILLFSVRFLYCQNTVYSEIVGEDEDRVSFGFNNSTLFLDNGKLLSPHFISKELDGNTLVPSTLTYIGNQIDIKSLYDTETENDRKKVREVMTMYHLNKVRTFSESVLTHPLQDDRYMVSTSEDGFTYNPVNEKPITNSLGLLKDSSALLKMKYKEEFVENDKMYWFKVQGFDYFGGKSKDEKVIFGMGSIPITMSPIIEYANQTDDNHAEIRWFMPENMVPLVDRYRIMR